MQIPLYQIKNILELYSRQLSLDGINRKHKFSDNYPVSMNTSSEGNRQVVIDKVVSSILDRIISDKPSEKNNIKNNQFTDKSSGENLNLSTNKNQFTYTVMDENNHMTSHTLPVEDSKRFVRRMLEMTRQVEPHMKS